MSIIMPFIDNIEFIVLALQHAHYDVTFVVLRDEKNVKKYDRFVKASTIIQEQFKNCSGKANFFYANIEKELAAINEKTKIAVLSDSIQDAIHKSMALEAKASIIVSYSITDYYLCSYMFGGTKSPFKNYTKDEIYRIASHWSSISGDIVKTYRQLDLERIEGFGLTHANIEWAHKEAMYIEGTDWLDKDYSEEQLQWMRFVRDNRYDDSQWWK